MAHQNKVSRRDFLRASAGGAATAFLAACGASPAAEAPADTTAQAVQATEAPIPTVAAQATGAPVATVASQTTTEAAVTSAPRAATELVQLRYGHWYGNLITPALPSIEEKYSVKITEEPAAFGEYWTKLLTQVAGGVAPDLLQMEDTNAGPFYTSNALAPLDEQLGAGQIDSSKWAFDLKRLAYKDQVLGLPMFLPMVEGLMINTDLIEKEGLQPPHPWPFWGTEEFDNWPWEKMVENLEAVTKRSSGGETSIYGLSETPGISRVSIYENGGELFDRYDYTETQTLINSPEAVEAIQRDMDLLLKHKVAPPIDAGKAFEHGMWKAQKAVAYRVIFSYNTMGHPDETGFQWRPIMTPHQQSRVILTNSNFASVNQKTAHLDRAATVVIALATDPEFTAQLFEAWNNLPVYDTAAYVAKVTDPHRQEFYKAHLARFAPFSECKPCTEDVEFQSSSYGRESQFVQNTLRTEREAIITQGKPVQQAMDDAKQAIDAQLAKSASS